MLILKVLFQKCQISSLTIQMNLQVKNGYILSYLITEFLITHFGKVTFLSWLQTPSEFILSLPKIDEEFQNYIMQKIETRIK